MLNMGREVSVDAAEQFRGFPRGLACRDGAASGRVDVGSLGGDSGGDEVDRLVAQLFESVNRVFDAVSMHRSGAFGDFLVPVGTFDDAREFRFAERSDADCDGNFRMVGADPSASDTGTPRMSGSSGDIRQQIGEILGTVRALDERMKDRQREAREETQLIHQELRTVKHDQRSGEQILSLRTEKVEKEVSKLTEQLHDTTKTITTMVKDLGDLQAPVTELVNMKRRFVAFAAFGMSIMAVLWALAEPIWAWAVHRFFGGPT